MPSLQQSLEIFCPADRLHSNPCIRCLLRRISFARLILLSALNGCTAVKVKLRMRIYLAKTPVASMQASLPKGPAIAPGQKLSLVAQLTQPDGKVLQTEGQGNGKVLWSELVVTPSVVTTDQKGHVTLPRDPRVSDGKMGHVRSEDFFVPSLVCPRRLFRSYFTGMA